MPCLRCVCCFLALFIHDVLLVDVIVDGGHRAIVFNRLSGVKESVLTEGMHFVIPWFEWPYIYDVRTKPRNIQVSTYLLQYCNRNSHVNTIWLDPMSGWVAGGGVEMRQGERNRLFSRSSLQRAGISGHSAWGSLATVSELLLRRECSTELIAVICSRSPRAPSSCRGRNGIPRWLFCRL